MLILVDVSNVLWRHHGAMQWHSRNEGTHVAVHCPWPELCTVVFEGAADIRHLC